MQIISLSILSLLSFVVLVHSVWNVPAGWPSTKLEIGRANGKRLRYANQLFPNTRILFFPRTVPWKVAEMEPNVFWRYQYLVGDPVSGGWQNWNDPVGAFGKKSYLHESLLTNNSNHS